MNEITMNIIGRVAVQPENIGVNGSCKFTVATDLKFNKETQEKEAIFITCLMFTSTAERYAKLIQHLTKGSKVFISGALNDVHAYISNKEGNPKAQVSVKVNSISFVSSSANKDDYSTQENTNIKNNIKNKVVVKRNTMYT